MYQDNYDYDYNYERLSWLLDNLYVYKKKSKQNQKNILILLIIVFVIILFIGVIGYRYLFNLNWMDCFYNSSLIISTLNLSTVPMNDSQKVFIMIYSLIAGLTFITIASRSIGFIIDEYYI